MRVQEEPASGNMVIREVVPEGLADRQGLRVGDVVTGLDLPTEEQFNRMRNGEMVPEATVLMETRSGRTATWRFGELPVRSRAVYPAQILSALNATLICLFLWAYYPWPARWGSIRPARYHLSCNTDPAGDYPQRRIERPIGQFPLDDLPDDRRPVAGLRGGGLVFHSDASPRERPAAGRGSRGGCGQVTDRGNDRRGRRAAT